MVCVQVGERPELGWIRRHYMRPSQYSILAPGVRNESKGIERWISELSTAAKTTTYAPDTRCGKYHLDR